MGQTYRQTDKDGLQRRLMLEFHDTDTNIHARILADTSDARD